jgi:hypothetical protein
MEHLGEDEVLYEVLNARVSILSSQIIEISICLKNYQLQIEIGIKLLTRKKDECLRLIFSDIKEYGFYHNSNHIFYNIEDYKLLRKEGLYYISFDPEVSEMTMISESDNDFILCGSIQGFFRSEETLA